DPRQSYVATFDTGGWDECFPAISPGPYPSGPWQGTPIPDHGDLWGSAWEVLCANDARIELAVMAPRFPVRFERALSLTESGLRLDYRVENQTAFDVAFLWCAHPLLASGPRMQLVLPDDTRLRQLGKNFGEPFEPPPALPAPNSQLAVKAFGRSPPAGWAALQDGDAEFRLQWDPRTVTHLGIWLNADGWSGVPGAPPYYNLAIEPGIGSGDDLAFAVSTLNDAGRLPAREWMEWTLYLHLR
ncbi:MAG: hypothetical protein KGR26_07065, partial [Cyanobacteria bacterium REEB65]|nr:hypothetical protein [Cyanobacteria bacterium REEB65]